MWLPFRKTNLNSISTKNGRENRPSSKGRLLKSLIKEYGTNREYTALFLDHMLRNYKDNPQYEIFLEAELGSLKRSREVIKSLCREFQNRNLFLGKECLDIGSSAGNSLIAFVEHGAARAIGIEISEGRYQTGLININGCPNDIKRRIQVFREDIQNDQITRIGQFDIIFCSDVLEHVQDPRQAVRQICRLLKNSPEAFACVRLRNFQHPENVIHEPHYDLPAMVLLPHELAKRYYDYCKPRNPIDYETLRWMSFYDYQNMFESFGKKCIFLGELNPEEAGMAHIEKEVKKLINRFDEISGKRNLDSNLKKEISKHIDEYRMKVEDLIREYRATGNRQLLEIFYLNYVVFDIVMLVTNEISNDNSSIENE